MGVVYSARDSRTRRGSSPSRWSRSRVRARSWTGVSSGRPGSSSASATPTSSRSTRSVRARGSSTSPWSSSPGRRSAPGSAAPTARRFRLLLQVCEGMEYLAQRSIVHRDLSPDNIFVVGEAGRLVPKILDFGIAKDTTAEETLHNFTRTGLLMGKPQYWSPEQIGILPPGSKIDWRSDVYTLGVIFYRVLTRPLPVRGRHPLLVHLAPPPGAAPAARRSSRNAGAAAPRRRPGPPDDGEGARAPAEELPRGRPGPPGGDRRGAPPRTDLGPRPPRPRDAHVPDRPALRPGSDPSHGPAGGRADTPLREGVVPPRRHSRDRRSGTDCAPDGGEADGLRPRVRGDRRDPGPLEGPGPALAARTPSAARARRRPGLRGGRRRGPGSGGRGAATNRLRSPAPLPGRSDLRGPGGARPPGAHGAPVGPGSSASWTRGGRRRSSSGAISPPPSSSSWRRDAIASTSPRGRPAGRDRSTPRSAPAPRRTSPSTS